MSHRETELKLQVIPRDLRKLRAARAFRRKSRREKDLVSVYFDTPKHTLAKNDVTLRVRHNGDNRLQTIKSGGAANSFRHGEWEDEIKGDDPNLSKAQNTALAPLLTKKLKHKLEPLFETRIHRTSVPVQRNGSRIEVALDEVKFALDGDPLPLESWNWSSSAAGPATYSSWRVRWGGLCPPL